jgi:hypothetical protein
MGWTKNKSMETCTHPHECLKTKRKKMSRTKPEYTQFQVYMQCLEVTPSDDWPAPDFASGPISGVLVDGNQNPGFSMISLEP